MLLRSIRPRLLGLVLATVLPFTALIGLGVWQRWHDDQTAAIQRAVNEARLLAVQVDDHIGNLANLLTGLSEAVSTNPADVAANDALLRRVKAELPSYIANILLFAPDGSNIGTSSDSGRFFAGDRKYVRQVLAGRRLAIGDVVRARTIGEWVVTIARPVEDRTGRLRGFWRSAPCSSISRMRFGSRTCRPAASSAIVNERGIVIARSVDSAEWMGRDLSTGNPWHATSPPRTSARSSSGPMASSGSPAPRPPTRSRGSCRSGCRRMSPSRRSSPAWRGVLLFISGALLTAFAIAWMLSGTHRSPAAAARQGRIGARSRRAQPSQHGPHPRRGRGARRQLQSDGGGARTTPGRGARRRRRDPQDQGYARGRDRRFAGRDRLLQQRAAHRALEPRRRADVRLHRRGGARAAPSFSCRPKARRKSQALFERAFSGETIRDVELRRLRKDGSRIDVRIDGGPDVQPRRHGAERRVGV